MTGPLAQQFAQAREAIEFGCGGGPDYESFYYEGLTALSVIERHVQDMEKALLFYAERRNYRPASGGHHDVPLGGWMEVRDSYDGRGAGARARAALPARERGGVMVRFRKKPVEIQAVRWDGSKRAMDEIHAMVSGPLDDALDRLLDCERQHWAPDPNRQQIAQEFDAALATVREALERLREERDALIQGLRPFAKQPCGKFSPSWDGPEFVPCGECKTCIARALLSASTTDGGGAK